MDVHFIDTSVFLNILNVPGRNEKHREIMQELKDLLGHKNANVLILPFATIIETGNHIAHCDNGSQRRRAAEKFRGLEIYLLSEHMRNIRMKHRQYIEFAYGV